jgi:hypothetical protein
MVHGSTNGNGSRLWIWLAGGIAAWSFLIEPYTDRTQDLKERVEVRHLENRREIDRLDARLSSQIQSEIKRNNEIEGRLSAVEAFVESLAGQTQSRFTKEDAQRLEDRLNSRIDREIRP